VHEAITDHSEGTKNLLSANLDQMAQVFKQGVAEIVAKQLQEMQRLHQRQTDLQEQMTSMQRLLQEQMTSMQARNEAVQRNVQIQAGNTGRYGSQGCKLLLLRKTVAGHPTRKSAEKVDKALLDVEIPFPVGSFPPSLAFFPKEGVAPEDIMRFTHSQIDDLAWFYNMQFDHPGEYTLIRGKSLA
jgi:hypothetical protein